jgi:hypothetical protein
MVTQQQRSAPQPQQPELPLPDAFFAALSFFSCIATWAAASLATGRRNGEQLT